MAGTLKLETVRYKKGTLVTVSGSDTKGQFYVISEGKVRIQRSIDLAGVAETDNMLIEGDYFNVIETMSGHTVMDTADAYTNVKLVVVKKSQFTEFAKRHISIVMNFLNHFSKKLTFFNDLISKQSGTAEEENGQKRVSKIFDIAEFYLDKKYYNRALYCYVKYIAYDPEGEHVKTAKERISKLTPYAKDAMNTQNQESGMIKTYKDGTMLCCDNEPGEEIFIIQKGKVSVTKVNEGGEQILAVLGEGDNVGEMSLLSGDPRGANLIAKGDVQVLAVNKDNFDMMIKSQPEMAKKLLESFADRIWKSYRQLTNMLLEDPLARLWDQLMVELETKRIETNTKSPYTFDFGPPELVRMVGIDDKEGKKYIKEMLQTKKMSIEEGNIHIPSLKDLQDEAQYYRNKEEREKRIKRDKMKRGKQ